MWFQRIKDCILSSYDVKEFWGDIGAILLVMWCCGIFYCTYYSFFLKYVGVSIIVGIIILITKYYWRKHGYTRKRKS